MRGDARPAPPSGRARPPASGPAGRRRRMASAVDRADRAGRGSRQRADHPGAAEEQVGPGRAGTGPLPAGQRVPGHEGGQVAAQLAGAGQRQLLHAGDVGVAAGQAAFLRGRERWSHRFGRHGQDGEIGRAAGRSGRGQLSPGAKVGREPDGGRISGRPARRPRRARERRARPRCRSARCRSPPAGAGTPLAPPSAAVTGRCPAAAPARRAGTRAGPPTRGWPVSTCISSRTTRGIAPGTSISVAHSSGTSWKPSLRAASAGNSAVRSWVAVNTHADHVVRGQLLRVMTSVTSSDGAFQDRRALVRGHLDRAADRPDRHQMSFLLARARARRRGRGLPRL